MNGRHMQNQAMLSHALAFWAEQDFIGDQKKNNTVLQPSMGCDRAGRTRCITTTGPKCKQQTTKEVRAQFQLGHVRTIHSPRASPHP